MWFWIGFALVCLLAAGLLTIGLCRAAARQPPDYLPYVGEPPIPAAHEPVTPSGRPTTICADCQRRVAARLGDGQPYRSHKCVIAVPTYSQDDEIVTGPEAA